MQDRVENPAPHAAEGGAARVDLSVLVPVLNEGAHLAATIASMRAQEYDGAIEFVFADGASSDDTRAILDACAARDPRIRVFDNPARHTPHGLNVCLARARGAIVARMDGHAQYPPDYLALGVARLGRGDVAWVSGPQLPSGDGWWSERVATALRSPLGRGGSRRWIGQTDEDGSDAGETELTSGSGVFLGVWLRSTLVDMGGWDEGWPANEDVELAARVEEQGGRLVSLDAMAAHYVPRNSPRSLARQYFRWGHYRVKTARRHPRALRLSHLGTPTLVSALIVAVIPGRSARVRLPRRAARLGSAAYVALLLDAVRRDPGVQTPIDALLTPAVFLTMHVGWGVGFLSGCCRFGPPTRALRAVLRRSAGAPSTSHEAIAADLRAAREAQRG